MFFAKTDLMKTFYIHQVPISTKEVELGLYEYRAPRRSHYLTLKKDYFNTTTLHVTGRSSVKQVAMMTCFSK